MSALKINDTITESNAQTSPILNFEQKIENYLIQGIVSICIKNDIYSDFDSTIEVLQKPDGTYFTSVDLKMNEDISILLKSMLPEVDIISEETANKQNESVSRNSFYFLTDPLDGTKNYIDNNDLFSINIALMFKEKPIAGFIYFPKRNTLYYTQGDNVKKTTISINNNVAKIEESEILTKPDKNSSNIIATNKRHANMDILEQTFEEVSKKEGKQFDLIRSSGSLKACKMMEGEYVKIIIPNPIMQWDLAAIHAMLGKMQASVKIISTNKKLTYSKNNLTLNEGILIEFSE